MTHSQTMSIIRSQGGLGKVGYKSSPASSGHLNDLRLCVQNLTLSFRWKMWPPAWWKWLAMAKASLHIGDKTMSPRLSMTITGHPVGPLSPLPRPAQLGWKQMCPLPVPSSMTPKVPSPYLCPIALDCHNIPSSGYSVGEGSLCLLC